MKWIALGMTEGLQPGSFHNSPLSGWLGWGEKASERHGHMACAHLNAPGLFLIRTIILGSFVFTGD